MNGVAASLYREYKIRMSSPRVFVENIANPLFVLLIFGFALGGTIGRISNDSGGSTPYLNYFVIGAVNISFISNALVASTKIFIDKYVGLYEEILSYPVRRSHILFGKLIFNLILSYAQAVVMIAFVAAITGNIELNWYRIILLVLVLALGSSTWFFSMVILAIKLKTQDAFNTAYFLIMTPIVFTSSTSLCQESPTSKRSESGRGMTCRFLCYHWQ